MQNSDSAAMRTLLDPPLPRRLVLSALWASLTFCYLYGDYFGLYKPGKLQHMLDGAGPVGPATQGSLLRRARDRPAMRRSRVRRR